MPTWALAALGAPADHGPLSADGATLVTADGARRYPVERGIALLVDDTREELERFAARFPAYAEGVVEILRPSQLHFRAVLRAFLAALPRDSVVADIASGEAEFAEHYAHLRYLPIDRSLARLRRALELHRVELAILGDLRHPPLREHSLDALVSTNTLNHFPVVEVAPLVLDLLRYVKPSGTLACTVSAPALAELRRALPGHAELTRVQSLSGPLARAWTTRVHRRAVSLSAKLPFGGDLLRAATASGAALVTRWDHLYDPTPERDADHLWLELRPVRATAAGADS